MTKSTIDMAREVYGAHTEWKGAPLDRLEQLVALVRADERNRTWTQEHWTEYERSIAAAEREACAKVCYELPWKDMGHIPSNLAFAAAIRARGNT